MIEKSTDFSVLSGVSSPLLPLIYAEGAFIQNDLDGMFVQTNSSGEMLSVFSLKNTCVTLHLKAEDNLDELQSFFSFCGVTEILSDRPVNVFCQSYQELNLLEFNSVVEEKSDCLILNQKSKVSDYNNIHNLVFRNSNNFDNWFPDFSKKINSLNAFATYFVVDGNVVSAAVSPGVYENSGVIAGVFTSENYRNKGYASKCVNALLKAFQAHNISRIYLWCEDKNLKFYKNLNFIDTGKIFIGECN